MSILRKSFTRYLFFGDPSDWYFGGEITELHRQAVIDWLDDRMKFHTWLTSIDTGTVVLLVTLGAPLNLAAVSAGVVVVGICLLLLALLVNIVSIWSIANWKLNIRIGRVSELARARKDIELVSLVAVASFLGGLTLCVIPAL